MKTVNINYIRHNIAPKKAKLIGVFDAEDRLVANINIDKLKKETDEPIYKFGVLSDVHQNDTTTNEPFDDFQYALNFFKEKGIKNVLICGDITEYFSFTERDDFIDLKNKFEEDGEYKIFTTTGNHDCRRNGVSDAKWLETWNTLAGKYPKTGEITDLQFTHSNGKTDHFILLGMDRYSIGPDHYAAYKDDDIASLGKILEEYKDDRCFIFTHLFFHHKAGNFKYSYPTAGYLLGPQFDSLNELNDKYPNTFWFSGHSHWKYNLQKYQKTANIFGKHCGWNIHVSSCASPITSKFLNGEHENDTTINSNKSGWTRETQKYDSEGLIVEVYEDYIITKGIVFKEGGTENRYAPRELKFVPCATYKLYPGSGDVDYISDFDFNECDYINASEFVLHPTKTGNNINNTDYPFVRQLTDDYDYVEVIFNAASQGFIIKPKSFLPIVSTDINKHATKCFIRVGDIKIFVAPANDLNQKRQLAKPPKYVGFYGDKHFYSNESQYGIYNDFNISTREGYDGAACFQTSSHFLDDFDVLYEDESAKKLNIGPASTQNVLIIQMKVKLGFKYLT